MAIRNVESTLPDEKYVRALEADNAELWRIVNKLVIDVSNLNRGL
jgi:hypothetical protein